MTNAMAKATYELVGGTLYLLPWHNLPAGMRQGKIDLNAIDPIAVCARYCTRFEGKLGTKFSAELNPTNAPVETKTGFWHAWITPCFDTETGAVSGVRVTYQ